MERPPKSSQASKRLFHTTLSPPCGRCTRPAWWTQCSKFRHYTVPLHPQVHQQVPALRKVAMQEYKPRTNGSSFSSFLLSMK